MVFGRHCCSVQSDYLAVWSGTKRIYRGIQNEQKGHDKMQYRLSEASWANKDNM